MNEKQHCFVAIYQIFVNSWEEESPFLHDKVLINVLDLQITVSKIAQLALF